MAESPAHGDRGNIARRTVLENLLAHAVQPVFLQVDHRRQREVLLERLEQLEARNPGGEFNVLQMQGLASIVVNVLPRPDQVVRQLHAQHFAQLFRIVVRLSEDQAFDQRTFNVPGEGNLLVEFAAAFQLGDEIARHAPPRSRRAVDRIHHRFEAQRLIQRSLQQALQGFTHGNAGDHHLDLAAIAGDRQQLVFIGRNDHPLVAVGLHHAAVLAQLLLAHQGQAQAVAAEVLGVFDIDGDIGAVFDGAQGRGHRLEHVGAVMEADSLGRRGHESMRPANTGHPVSRGLKIIAVDTNVATLRIGFAVHHGAPTGYFPARSDGASQAWKRQVPSH
ncbi:hypothetical protein D3C76_770010 [compost metagenome]